MFVKAVVSTLVGAAIGGAYAAWMVSIKSG